MLFGLKFCQICFILGSFHSLLFNEGDLLCQEFVLLQQTTRYCYENYQQTISQFLPVAWLD